MKIEQIAKRLDEAATSGIATPMLTGNENVTVREAADIQKLLIDYRIKRGAHKVGLKMGFTSKAKMAQMGVSDLIWGRLTSDMWVEEDSEIKLSDYVHPRVEPEICYLIGKRLEGNVTLMEALAAVEAVAPALEIIDSRYRDFKFALPDVIADNASSSGFVIGQWHHPDTDVGNLGLIMSFDGRPVELGSSAAILGNPIRGLVAAARLAAEQGEALEPGSIVLAGAATAAVALSPGVSVKCEFQSLGSVSFSTTE